MTTIERRILLGRLVFLETIETFYLSRGKNIKVMLSVSQDPKHSRVGKLSPLLKKS